ncbi:hypothetical protein [uncultured Aquitalea sp.]|uniref:hypothetical protein n=1 Tax=uncultured Aquitalea sp. TaxID=540272 RepID=UPI0025F80ED7|nr:hypothetical protein [uncultured Aquitalea sp.]
MDTQIFDQYASAIRAAASPGDPSLRMAAEGQIEIFYAPFEAVNSQAKLVLVGITPGRVQAANALAEARRQLAAGATSGEAMRKAKEVGAFSGPMRANLTAMLDHIGLDRWLGAYFSPSRPPISAERGQRFRRRRTPFQRNADSVSN